MPISKRWMPLLVSIELLTMIGGFFLLWLSR
jgi:hypothetical protein